MDSIRKQSLYKWLQFSHKCTDERQPTNYFSIDWRAQCLVKMNHLEENLLKSLLSKTPSIDIRLTPIDCSDHRNAWLQNEPEVNKIRVFNETAKSLTFITC